MSFESIFITTSNIALATQRRIVGCFDDEKLFKPITSEFLDDKSSHTYSYVETQRQIRTEDFLVSIEKKEVYLCFYSATTEQQKRITHLLRTCLHEAGIEGEFEEI